MTSVVRYTEIVGGEALLTSAYADSGDEFASQKVRRIFSAADIGTGSGQTQDTTSDPTVGCLVAQFTGSRIKSIINLQLWRAAAASHTTVFNSVVVGSGANTTSIGLRVSYNPKLGISSIYLIDEAADAPGLIVENDWIELDVLLGDTVSEPTIVW